MAEIGHRERLILLGYVKNDVPYVVRVAIITPRLGHPFYFANRKGGEGGGVIIATLTTTFLG